MAGAAHRRDSKCDAARIQVGGSGAAGWRCNVMCHVGCHTRVEAVHTPAVACRPSRRGGAANAARGRGGGGYASGAADSAGWRDTRHQRQDRCCGNRRAHLQERVQGRRGRHVIRAHTDSGDNGTVTCVCGWKCLSSNAATCAARRCRRGHSRRGRAEGISSNSATSGACCNCSSSISGRARGNSRRV